MEYSRRTNNIIASLRGLPQDHSIAKLRPAYTLGNLIEVLEERYKLGQSKVEDLIAQHWNEIAGQHAAHRSSPQRVVGNSILLIQVSSPVLRQEMQFNQRQILDRIHKLPGGGVIKALNFRAG